MKQKNKKNLPLKRIISNNLFALNIFLRTCPGQFVYMIVVPIIRGLSETLHLFILRYVVDIAQNGGDFLQAIFFLFLMFILRMSIRVSLNAVDARIFPKFTYSLNEKMKRMTLEKTARCELACYENPEFYNRYTRAMAQGSERVERVAGTIYKFMYCIVTFIGAGSLALTIDPVVLVFALFPFAMTFISKRRKNVYYEMDVKSTELVRHKMYSLRAFYQRNFACDMHMTDISEPVFMRFKKAVDASVDLCKQYGFKVASLWFIEAVAGSILSNYLPLLYAGWQILGTGNMTYGDGLVIVDTITYLYESLKRITDGYMDFYEHALFIENLRSFLDREPAISENREAPKAQYGDIELKDVHFRYDGCDKDVLDGVSMKIGKGEKIALVGHNGAGKTTLIKLLMRLYDPTSGQITINGEDERDLNLESVRDMYAPVLQDYKLFSMSVKENVLLRPEREGDDELVEDALKQVGAWDRVCQMPHGINSTLYREFDDEGVVPSGGELQKLSIAHIYAKGSPVVILDEPSSALDPIAEYEMYKNMMKACEDKSVVIISHRLSSAVIADRVYLLEHGRVIESGSHKELMALNGKYATMFRRQAQNYVDVEWPDEDKAE